jgi:hypothetical protein
MFTVEKNVPLASKKAYPFDQMEVGDSFFVPAADDKKIGYIRAQINNVKKDYPNRIIATRRETGGLRVWLLAAEKK